MAYAQDSSIDMNYLYSHMACRVLLLNIFRILLYAGSLGHLLMGCLTY